MAYCENCKVLFSPEVSECVHCQNTELVSDPPDPSQGEWVPIPIIPGIVEAQQVGDALDEEAIQYYINQPGTTTNIVVGEEKYEQAKEIQENVLGY